MPDTPKSQFWNNILGAAGTEPREAKSIRGASGFSHPVVAVGVDDGRQRVVMISGEGDARSAALAQGDIQATLPSVNVVMARPVAVNLGDAARMIRDVIGRVNIQRSDIEWIGEHQEDFDERARELAKKWPVILSKAIKSTDLNFVALFKDIIQQLSLIEIEQREASPDESGSWSLPNFDLSRLAVLDPAEADRELGVCSIPLYAFSQEEIERLDEAGRKDEAENVLHRLDVLQYFFPAVDQLALGVVDRERLSPSKALERLAKAPQIGHPFGASEVIDTTVTLDKVVAALQERGLLVEGELGIELSPNGRELRAKVQFKPREGLISKISRIFSVKLDVNLKDLMK